MRSSRGRRIALAAAAIVAGLAVRAPAHSTPFSYVDLRVQGARIDITISAHVDVTERRRVRRRPDSQTSDDGGRRKRDAAATHRSHQSASG